MANRYSKALKHIKGKKNLSEAPTNSLSGVYALNKPGTRLSKPPADGRIFLPDIDGNYPPGIPGTPGEPFFKRGDGFWSGEVDWDTITTPSFANSEAGSGGTDTSTLIDESSGVVLTALPPNSRHFILGPLVDGHTYLHGSDAYTNIGYIQKDTRQFVLLARVDGQWESGGYETPSFAVGYGWGEARVWDGSASGFTSYNPEFTLEMAQWFQTQMTERRFVKDVAYYYSGGVAQPPIGNPPAPGMFGGSGVGAGGDGTDANATGSGLGYGSGGEPTIGTAENETPGGPEEAGFPWGLGQLWDDLKDKAEELWDNLTDKAEDLVDDIGEFLGDVFDNAQDMAEGAADLYDSLGEAVSDAYEGVNDTVGNATDALGDAISDAWGSASEFADSVGDAFSGAADALGDAFGSAMDWAGNNQGAIADALSDSLPAFVGRAIRSVSDPLRYAGEMMFQGNPFNPDFGSVRPAGASNYWSPDPSTAGTYTNPGAGKGVPGTKPNPTGQFTSAPRPSNTPRVSRSPLGQPQFKFPQGATNSLDNMITNVADNAVVSAAGRTAATRAGTQIGRAVPFIGAGIAIADAGIRISNGDYGGAFLSAASALPGPIGWIALGAQISTDIAGITGGSYSSLSDEYIMESKIGNRAKDAFYEIGGDKIAAGDWGAAFLDELKRSEDFTDDEKAFIAATFGGYTEGIMVADLQQVLGMILVRVANHQYDNNLVDLNPYTNPFPTEEEPWGNLDAQKESKIIKVRSVRSVIREQATQAPTVDANSSPGEINSNIIKTGTDKFASEYVKNHGVEKAQELKDKTEGFMQEQDIPTNEERASQPQIQDPESNSDEDIWDRLGDMAKEFWKRTNYASLDAKGMGVVLDQTQWFASNIVDFMQRLEIKLGLNLPKTISKAHNNISIARSIISGEIIEHRPILTEVNMFKESLTIDNFISKKLKISTSPVPYADDNIYIDENGKTHVNHGEYASLANDEWGFHPEIHDDNPFGSSYGSLAASGKGFAQMVIPPDGSEPYVLFEDYNYHNLNSIHEGEVPNVPQEILSALTHLIGESPISSLLTHVFIGHLRNAANNYDRIFDSLKDKQGLPGWPKGIHGAAHTKFQVPLNQLPKETQDMIKDHPLLWPKERIENLPLDERVEIYKSVDVKDPAVRAYFDESFDRIIKDHPELKSNWDESGRAYKERRELLAKRKQGNDPATQVKIDAAYKALQDAKWGEDGVRWSSLPEEDQFKMAGVSHKEYTKLREKVQGYDHRFDYANQQVDYLASVAETDKLTQLYTTYNQIQQNAYAPIKGMNDALGVVDGQIKGTDQQKQQYQKLVADYRKAYEEMMVHFRARQSKMMETSRLHQNYMNEFDNTWKKASQMFNQVQSTLNAKIDELRRAWEVAKTNGVDGINKRLKELEQEIKEIGIRNEPLAKAFDDDYLYDFKNWKFGQDYPDVDVDPWTNPKMTPTSVDDGYGGSGPAQPTSSPEEPVQDDPTYGGADAATAAVMAGARRRRNEEYRKKYESELLAEYKLDILKDIKKPVEVCEVPFQKLRKYKPNFVGKFTPQNVPSATASHDSDKLIDKANARGQTWRSENRYWQGYETTERMNLIQDRLGHGNQAWEKIIDEARNKNGWKNREIQEQLNIIAHTKAMKDMNPDYEDPFTYLQLQEMGNVEPSKDLIGDEKRKTELDTYLKDPLVKRVAKKVKSTLDYKDKPAKKGYPDKEPPKMEKGMHPQFGKGKEGYYSKLDPQSANAMPPQEDEVIDKQVEKAKTKPELDTIPFRDSLFKKLADLRDKQKKELTKN